MGMASDAQWAFYEASIRELERLDKQGQLSNTHRLMLETYKAELAALAELAYDPNQQDEEGDGFI